MASVGATAKALSYDVVQLLDSIGLRFSDFDESMQTIILKANPHHVYGVFQELVECQFPLFKIVTRNYEELLRCGNKVEPLHLYLYKIFDEKACKGFVIEWSKGVFKKIMTDREDKRIWFNLPKVTKLFTTISIGVVKKPGLIESLIFNDKWDVNRMIPILSNAIQYDCLQLIEEPSILNALLFTKNPNFTTENGTTFVIRVLTVLKGIFKKRTKSEN